MAVGLVVVVGQLLPEEKLYIGMVQQRIKNRRIAMPGDALPGMREVVVIVIKPDRQAFENARGQIRRLTTSLFLCVTVEKSLIEPFADIA